ncbi:MAG TPA: tetratricopeptide repeat protein [Trebonia sp.]
MTDERTARGRVLARRARIDDSQGVQVGDHNIQYNTFLPPERPSAGPSAVGEIPRRPAAFQPRTELLTGLRSAGPGLAMLTGMPGTGKTQAAAAFARECADAGWRLVGWIDGKDLTSTVTDLARVARQLGYERLEIGTGASTEEAARAVRNWLDRDGRNCLLVFDNVTNPDAVLPFVPATGQSMVVMTTAGPLPAGGRVVRVDVFSPAEGLTYLAERTGLPDDAGAPAVGEELGWLPLALAQAGSVIAKQRLSCRDYLGRLRSVRVEEYLSVEPGDPYPRGVAQSVLLSLDGVAGDSEAAAECRALLELVSVLSLAGVPRELLRAESGREPRQADEAIGRLAERSLLSFSGDDDLVVAHRMVMRVVRERAQRQGTLAAAGTRACGLLNTALDSLDDLWGHRTDAHDFVDQVISLSQNLRPCLGDNPELAQALLDLRSEALFLRIKLGDAIGPAVEFGESLRADCLRLHGGKHRQTLWAQNDLARAYQAAGQLDKAIRLFEDTLEVSRKKLGKTDPDTLSARYHLALVYRAAGRTDEAIALHEESLAVCARKLGAAAPETMTARDELARAYRAARRLPEAIELFELTLAYRENALDEDPRAVSASRRHLARAYRAAGQVDRAIELFERTVADSKQRGEVQPMLAAQDELAYAYRAAGRLGEAISLYRGILADREEVLGDRHPSTLQSRDHLGRAYRAAGRLDEAIPLLERNLRDREEMLGEAHPATLKSRDHLARANRAAGPLDEPPRATSA